MQKAVIRHSKGLHARVAAMVVQKSHELQEKYGATLYFQIRSHEPVLANSLIPIVALRVKVGDEISVSGKGPMASTAVAEMVEFLESDFLISDSETISKVDNVLQNNAFTAELVFNSMANGLVVTDENDIITVFNPSAEKIMAIKADKAIGKNVCEVIPHTRLHIVSKTMVPELGSRQVIEKAVIITNRTPLVVDGQSKGAVAIFEDISSLENVTGELREVKELKERLHLILESVQDGICVVDKKGIITYVNPAYTRITQTPAAKLIGRNIAHISPLGARSKALLTGKPVLGSISRKANGQTIVANVNPIVIDNEVAGVVSVVKNMSEVQAIVDKLNEVTARAEYLEQELRRAKKPSLAFNKFVGRSGIVLDALAIAAKAAEGHSTVLIRGESGTGKELVAEGIHFASPRARGPFIRVNCAAIPTSLLESELFGHEKGAFTGAVKRKLGSFELADKGTIFLDEIGDLEKSVQAKLLRVLQKKEFQRVGGEGTISVDVRIIAATNRDLEKMVAGDEFREDLYYRLNIIPIVLPPLWQRKEDIPLLVEHFLRSICAEQNKKLRGIKPDALEVLIKYRWPGNVRELANIMERMITLAEGPYIGIDDLPIYLRQELYAAVEEPGAFVSSDTVLPWEAYERIIIENSLRKYGTFNRAAKALGLTHKTVATKARKYGLEKMTTWEKV
ncbi:sigma 54-interacting transcriptional regulator [Anaeroselena agilis]|uniref:HTH-type transcriptional regulatory protein TyrR n=1 Tax=Anaeroselena agilis TaxID=3063788 RepID=A0ABU3P1Z1_9FIRM|nr:sigma 54-interacting transcriptional regulator [Selenomonadales bacterium 4137-cl]